MRVDSLSFTRKWLVTGMTSSMLKSQIKFNETKLPQDCCLYGRYPWIRPAVECDRLVEGELKLYFSVREPPIMYLAWKLLRYLSCYVDNESIPPKILIYLCF